MDRSPRELERLSFAALIALVASVFAPTSVALEFECNAPNDERFIHVALPGEDHLCEVVVDYPTGIRRVLWYADHDTLFCSAKAYELRDKYETNWNFTCSTWPDRDGIDSLSARQRYVLDAQLKRVMNRLAQEAESSVGAGDRATTDGGVERVLSVKAAVPAGSDDTAGLLALQYFIGETPDEVTRDLVQVVADDGERWRTVGEVRNLIEHIDAPADEPLTAAVLTGVSDAGTIEVTTGSAASADATHRPGCIGRQDLQLRRDGPPLTKSEFRSQCGQS